MTDDRESCYLCGRRAVQFHHIFGKYNRKKATEDGLWIPVCLDCHIKIHNEPSQRTNYCLMQDGQWKYEETHTRDEFMKRYGKNYL